LLSLAADENFDQNIIRGALRRSPTLDILQVQDAGLRQSTDPEVLEWAARLNRVLLTHDVNTLPGHAYARATAGLPMPGVFAVPDTLLVSLAVEDLLILAHCGHPGEFEGQVRYFPL